MTREEAVEILKDENERQGHFKSWSIYSVALEMAIETLEQEPKWIPVSERLPEVGRRVIFSMKNDEIYTGILHVLDDGLKITLEPTGIGYVYSFDNVVAWMPLPEPYKAESEDKE